jgi:xanthine dehydrogenase YagR molybdenum-binding subunit
MSVASAAIGAPVDRIEGGEKVRGEATYAYEYEQENAAYAVIVQSTIAKGTVAGIDASEAAGLAGVVAVLTHENATKLHTDDGELAILQSPRVAYRGQIVGAVIAETLEAAQEAARHVRISYDEQGHDVELRDDHPGLYKPDKVNPSFETDTDSGAFDSAFASARRTPRLRSTTTRWSRTPRSRCGTAATSRCTTRTRARSPCSRLSPAPSGSSRTASG